MRSSSTLSLFFFFFADRTSIARPNVENNKNTTTSCVAAAPLFERVVVTTTILLFVVQLSCRSLLLLSLTRIKPGTFDPECVSDSFDCWLKNDLTWSAEVEEEEVVVVEASHQQADK